jgi:GNAT superfamily N-acetyltransferase
MISATISATTAPTRSQVTCLGVIARGLARRGVLQSGVRWERDETERIALADGTGATVRAIRPEDKELLARGMARLSTQSRWSRFHYARGELTDAELAYLTEVDGTDHFAIGAVGDDGEGLGVARFIRLEPGGEIAEAAVAVADDAQGKGLGRALLERLVAAARERGVTRFRAEVLEGNAPMIALLRAAGGEPRPHPADPGVLVVDLPLPEPTPAGGLLAEILRQVAQGLLRIRAAR